MPSTHSSLHCHLVFSTKNRVPSIAPAFRDRLHAYLGGILKWLEAVPLEIGGVSDHVHILAGLKTTHSVADVLRVLKGDSSTWMHKELRLSRFAWQEGYGAFSVSRSDIDGVREYIRKQEEHHRTRTFQEEYLEFLKEHGIDYDERYLW